MGQALWVFQNLQANLKEPLEDQPLPMGGFCLLREAYRALATPRSA